MVLSQPPTSSGRRSQFEALDVAVYAAIAETPTPTLDRDFGRLSTAANHSRLWIVTAAALALTGPRGRAAAVNGLVAVGLTSAVINLVAKPLYRRRRPDRSAHRVPLSRHVRMPDSTSFPSGHSGSAFAFAAGVGDVLPSAKAPLDLAAALVAYSRVHTGVHYPGDVIVGSLIGSSIGSLTATALEYLHPRGAGRSRVGGAGSGG